MNSTAAPLLLRGVELAGRGPLDVRVRDGCIEALAQGLARQPGEAVIDARGGALLPGLHDHHIHLFALAAADASVPCGPPAVTTRAELERALAEAVPDGGWVRGVGYHESVAGPLDRRALDELVGERRVRVQHRTGVLWMLSSAALAALRIDGDAVAPGIERDGKGRPTGRLWRLDAWLRERLGRRSPPELTAVSQRLARLGVTGVTDATATNGPDELRALETALGTGELAQRLVVMGRPDLVADAGLAQIGPVKLILTEDELPPLETLVHRIRDAHERGRAVGIHCVTLAEIVLAASALESAGATPADRIEHASVTPPGVAELLGRVPVTVVTQPHFLWERGDVYRNEVEARDRPWLYRAAGLIAAGLPLGGGTDAPFGAPDPWRAMQAAVDRRTRGGSVLGPDEALSPEAALSLFTTAPEAPGAEVRPIAPGFPADLCLLDRSWSRARAALADVRVRATLIAGRLVYDASSG